MKETFYFSHDYNSRNDSKLVEVMMNHGVSGIGIFWCIVEMLYEEGGYLPLKYERITFELRTEKDLVQSIINDYGLFENDGEKFWSNSIIDRLKQRQEKSEKAKKSIQKRWDKVKNTNVLRTKNESNTIKERKGKENKETIYIGATRSEVLEEINNIVIYWNDTWKEERKVTPKLQEAYLKVRRDYPKDDIKLALKKYTDRKKKEPDYLLDPLRFFTQKNGFITYL